MESFLALLMLIVAVVMSGAFGLFMWRAYEQMRTSSHYRKCVCAHEVTFEQDSDDASAASVSMRRAPSQKSGSFDERIIERTGMLSQSLSLGHGLRLLPRSLVSAKWLEAHALTAGIAGEITAEGFCEMRARMTLIGALIGALVGCLFSVELAFLLAIVGAVLGFYMMTSAIKRRIRHRTQEMEHHLPEMLDVVALGMRSGLSFDRSLQLYLEHFDTLLARSLELAQQQWTCGLVPRDEALRSVTSTYDSALFSRVVEGIIRSLRFGSSMVESLESAATEVRTSYRAQRQEQVAKAPVKMMIPTGVLILPAMLILVLGPVLLELVGDF